MSIKEKKERKKIREKRFRYKFIIEQTRRLCKIKKIVREIEEKEKEDDEEKSNDDDNSSDEKNQKKQKRLKDHVLMYLLSLLNHNLKNNEYRSMFMNIMIMLRVNSDCEWKNVLNYMLKISVIVTVIRMLMLYQIKKKQKNKMIWLMKQNAWNRKNAKKQASSYFKLIKKMINCFMILINHNRNFNLMNWMLCLHIYRMKIRYNTNTNNMIEWKKNKLLFSHINFIMSAL